MTPPTNTPAAAAEKPAPVRHRPSLAEAGDSVQPARRLADRVLGEEQRLEYAGFNSSV